MFTRKRRVRKEGGSFRKGIAFLAACLFSSIVLAFIYLHFPNSKTYFNPVLQLNANPRTSLSDMLSKANIKYKKIESKEDSLTVILSDDSEVIFSSKKDFGNQVSSLQLTLSRLTIDGKKLKSLDFRFDNPVISFK